MSGTGTINSHSAIQPMIDEMQFLLGTPHGEVRHANGKTYAPPRGYNVGFIVNASDWVSRDAVAVCGELVYFDPDSRDVRFASEYGEIIFLVDKGQGGVACVGRIFDGIVRWNLN